MAEPDFLHNDRRLTRVEEQIKLINERLSRMENAMMDLMRVQARSQAISAASFAVLLVVAGGVFFG